MAFLQLSLKNIIHTLHDTSSFEPVDKNHELIFF